MRKTLIPLATVGAVAAVAAPVLAQSDNPTNTTVKGTATVTPSKAGTKKHPKGVKLKVHVQWTTPDPTQRPIVTGGTVYFPKGSLYNGAKYPKCSEQVMDREGVEACPKKSIMGSGTGTAWADTVTTTPKITVVNGGAKKVFLFTVLTNPARVAMAVPGTITKLTGAKWAYKLVLTVPEELRVVAGVPITLTDLTVTSGGKSWAKDWLATTGCTGGKWPYEVTTTFEDAQTNQPAGEYTTDDSTPCKK